ncbi:MAG TPA: hypothetical protein VLN26_01235 [Gaiellaceae bacterium]|nr:hypothetical protein [Gaiellaceae bacterium]
MPALPELERETAADAVARRLTSHIDGIARALAATGAPQEESSRLLELAAMAAMHAVTLAEVAAEPPERARRAAPAPPAAARQPPRLSAAA